MKKKDAKDQEHGYELVAHKINFNHELYYEFLKIINAPPYLAVIIDISECFLNGLNLIEEAHWKEFDELKKYRKIAIEFKNLRNLINKNDEEMKEQKHWLAENIKKKNHEEKREEKESAHPAYGFQVAHPIYTAFCQKPKDGGWKEKNYIYLLMHILCAYIYFKKNNKNNIQLLKIDNMYRQMKLLSVEDKDLELLRFEYSPEKLVECWKGNDISNLRTIEREELALAKGTRLRVIMNAILRLRGIKAPRNSGGGGQNFNSLERAIYHFNMVDYGVLHIRDLFEEKLEAEVVVPLIKNDLYEIDKGNDVHPAETRAGNVCLVSHSNKKQQVARYKSRYQEKIIIMKNQDLLYEFNNFTIVEVAMIMNVAGKLFKSEKRKVENIFNNEKEAIDEDEAVFFRLKESLHSMQYIAILMMQVWLGRNRKEVLNIKIDEKTNDEFTGLLLTEIDGVDVWEFPVVCPKHFENRDRKNNVYNRIKVPDYFHIASYLRSINKYIKSLGRNYIFSLFTEAIHREKAKYLIEKVNQVYSVNLKPKDMQFTYFLKNQFITNGFAPVIAALITGQKYANIDTQLHYVSVQSKFLFNAYKETVGNAIDKIYDELGIDKEAKNDPVYDEFVSNVIVGIHIRPTIDEVNKLVSWLKEKINTSKSYEEKHNYYTVYFLLFQAYTTSFRSVINPIIHDGWIDRKRKVAVLSDKDGLASNDEDKSIKYYNSRHIPLTNDFLKQLEFYKKHQEIIFEKVVTKKIDLEEKKDLIKNKELFFIEDKSTILCSPSKIEAYIKDIYDYPLNANRRFLCSLFHERRVPSEYIDGFMSHGAIGQKMFNDKSSFMTQIYYQIIGDEINMIAKECGWEAIQSPFRNRV